MARGDHEAGYQFYPYSYLCGQLLRRCSFLTTQLGAPVFIGPFWQTNLIHKHANGDQVHVNLIGSDWPQGGVNHLMKQSAMCISSHASALKDEF